MNLLAETRATDLAVDHNAVVSTTRSTGSGSKTGIGLAVGCSLLIGIAAWWAWAVPKVQKPIAPDSDFSPDRLPVGANRSSPAPLDLAAFQAPLWVAPPAPPALPTPLPTNAAAEPPPPALKWQLLAIVSGQEGSSPSGELRAIVFDPATDSIIELSAGQQLAAQTIESIETTCIVVRTGKHVLRLALDETSVGGVR